MAKIVLAQNGSPTAEYSGVFLHSRYNPVAEAEKYVLSISVPPETTHFILLECALGYIIPALKKRFPGSAIISLHCDNFFRKAQHHGDSEFYEGNINSFLERTIPENAELKIIEWRPSLAAYKEKYFALAKEAAQFVKLHNANKRTVSYFAERWEKNARRNVKLFKNKIELKTKIKKPIVVAAAGPSLEAAISEIKHKRESVYLLAVSSAAASCYAHGVRPDMVAATDGGFWAASHLFEVYRFCRAAKNFPVIAAALHANIPSCCVDAPFLPISDGSALQNSLLAGENYSFITLPSRGTVGAAALDIAFYFTDAPVYIAGLDLRFFDIISHARPHAFYAFLRPQERRFCPYYSTLFTRALLTKEGGSLAVYASWFLQNRALYEKRLIILGAGSNDISTFGIRYGSISE